MDIGRCQGGEASVTAAKFLLSGVVSSSASGKLLLPHLQSRAFREHTLFLTAAPVVQGAREAVMTTAATALLFFGAGVHPTPVLSPPPHPELLYDLATRIGAVLC